MELLAVLHAIILSPSNVNLRIFVDNTVIINGLARGGTYNTVYAEMCERIRKIIATKHITLILEKVDTDDNPADQPTRHPERFKRIPHSKPKERTSLQLFHKSS